MAVTSLSGNQESRKYLISDCISFRKTNESFGGLSNMAPGYIININGEKILTSEALYQALRFPQNPQIQQEILKQSSPMTAKMISKKYILSSRKDWNEIRISIMRWCLRAKLASNWKSFGALLESTHPFNIVEDSERDDFWGAKKEGDYFIGVNALGRLLMELRMEYWNLKNDQTILLHPLKIEDFVLCNKKISTISFDITAINNENDRPLWQYPIV